MAQYPWERVSMDDFIAEAEAKFSRLFNMPVAEITDAIGSACAFFGIPYPDMVYNLTYQQDGRTMFVNSDPSTYDDDVICFNLKQLRNLGATNKESFSLIMTHECAHRYFQKTTFPGLNNGVWEEELACDYFMGVRSQMQHMDIRRVAEELGRIQGWKGHPDGDLRYQAIMEGQRAVVFLAQNNYALSMDNLMSCFEQYRQAVEPTIFAREQKYQYQQL